MIINARITKAGKSPFPSQLARRTKPIPGGTRPSALPGHVWQVWLLQSAAVNTAQLLENILSNKSEVVSLQYLNNSEGRHCLTAASQRGRWSSPGPRAPRSSPGANPWATARPRAQRAPPRERRPRRRAHPETPKTAFWFHPNAVLFTPPRSRAPLPRFAGGLFAGGNAHLFTLFGIQQKVARIKDDFVQLLFPRRKRRNLRSTQRRSR